jgi:hypothetical protein
MNPGHSRISHLKSRWEEEDAARDALELQARREFLEQDANEIFTSMETYFTRLAKIIRATGASVQIAQNWEHIRGLKLRRTTKVTSAGQQLHLNLTVQGASIFYRDKSYRIPRGIEALIPIITSDVEQFLDICCKSDHGHAGQIAAATEDSIAEPVPPTLRAMASRPQATDEPDSAMPFQRSAASIDSIEASLVSALLPAYDYRPQKHNT